MTNPASLVLVFFWSYFGLVFMKSNAIFNFFQLLNSDCKVTLTFENKEKTLNYKAFCFYDSIQLSFGTIGKQPLENQGILIINNIFGLIFGLILII